MIDSLGTGIFMGLVGGFLAGVPVFVAFHGTKPKGPMPWQVIVPPALVAGLLAFGAASGGDSEDLADREDSQHAWTQCGKFGGMVFALGCWVAAMRRKADSPPDAPSN